MFDAHPTTDTGRFQALSTPFALEPGRSRAGHHRLQRRPRPGGTVAIYRADGSGEVRYGDGRWYTWAPDGSGSWGDATGNCWTWNADGSRVWIDSHGNAGMVGADGSRCIHWADGRVETVEPDGTSHTVLVDGIEGSTAPRYAV